MMAGQWLVDHTAVATSNVNGWTTRPPDCKDPRRRLLVRMLKEQGVHICAVQEHHITTAPELESQRFWLEKQGYGVTAVPTPQGYRGGVMLIWSLLYWKAISQVYIGHRVVIAEPEHLTTTRVVVVAGHFHHDAPERQRQWERVEAALKGKDGPVIMLCDHNSYMVPESDNSGVKESKLKAKYNRQARALEAQCLSASSMYDVWDVLQGEREDRPAGYTYDWKRRQDTRWRPRRLDRIHVSECLRGADDGRVHISGTTVRS